MTDREFIHKLYETYYGGVEKIEMPLTNDLGKGRCVVCGFRRKLGLRGHAKAKCKKCRKAGA